MATTKKSAAKQTQAKPKTTARKSAPTKTEPAGPDENGMIWSEEHGQMVPHDSMRARQLTNSADTTP
jgi:hypothetical protein